MENTYKTAIIFGEDACRAYDNGKKEWERYVKENGRPGYVEHTFSTEGERDAYYQGIEDMFGWNNYMDYEGEPD